MQLSDPIYPERSVMSTKCNVSKQSLQTVHRDKTCTYRGMKPHSVQSFGVA